MTKCGKCGKETVVKALPYLVAPSGTQVDEAGNVEPGKIQETGMVVDVAWCESCQHVESLVSPAPYFAN